MKTLKKFNPQEEYRYVVRFTFDPKKDLKRNWSTFANAECEFGPIHSPKNKYQARMGVASWLGIDRKEIEIHDTPRGFMLVNEHLTRPIEFRWHNGLKCYAQVHYEGLGAWELNANTLEEAIAEATNIENEWFLPCTFDEGDGHFYASEVVGYVKVPGKEHTYIFILE